VLHSGQTRTPESKPLGMARQQEALPLPHAQTGSTLAKLTDVNFRTAAVEKDVETSSHAADHLGPMHIAGSCMT